MEKVWKLRYLVTQGFTIQNRKALKALVGEKEYERLINLAEKSGSVKLGNEKVSYANISLGFWQGQLNLKIKPRVLGIAEQYNDYQVFQGSEIKSKNIKDRLKLFISRRKNEVNKSERLPESSLKTSSTMQRLYSDEFRTRAGMNEDGYYVTTLIDTKTGKPVEAYVKQIEPEEKKSKISLSSIKRERWGVYLKDSDGKYVLFGDRSFYIDKKSKAIMPGSMSAHIGPTHQYAGIGLREHQIAIERMMQEGLSSVKILSTGEAFPFHYKAGFRTVKEVRAMPVGFFDMVIEELARELNVSKDKVLNFIPKPKNGEFIPLSSKDVEKLRKQIYLEKNGAVIFGSSSMRLSGCNLKKWIERIQSQPILLSS